MQLIRLNGSRQPNTISMWVVGTLIVSFVVVSFALGFMILYSWEAISAGETWALVVLIILAALLVIFCVLMSIQPRQRFSNVTKPFKVRKLCDWSGGYFGIIHEFRHKICSIFIVRKYVAPHGLLLLENSKIEQI